MLSVMGTPPCARALHALLNNVAVGTFNFSRAYGQFTLDRPLVVELFAAVEQVSVALPHRGIAILCCWRFKMRLQLLQDFIGLVGLESLFLLIHPRCAFWL